MPPIFAESTKAPGLPQPISTSEMKYRLRARASKRHLLCAREEGSTMRWCPILVMAAVVLACSAPEGSAQIFGSKKPKTPPQQRVPELIGILTTEKSDHKRAEAAEELRQFDPKDFPEIIPVLIEALKSDASSSVRVEVATGLGRLRPVTVLAGQALDKAASSDSNLRVRIQAKTSLIYYQMSGYHAPKKTDPPATAAGKSTTEEPPLAGNEASSKAAQVDKTSPTAPPTFRQLPSAPQPSPTVPIVTPPNPTPTPAPAATLEPPLLQPGGPVLQSIEGTGPRLSPP
jgi:hypothetical protein